MVENPGSTTRQAVQLAHGRVVCTRDDINVIFPREGDRAGNTHWPRGSGSIIEQVRECVRRTITEVAQPGWQRRYPEYAIYINPDCMHRGQYDYSVYSAGTR